MADLYGNIPISGTPEDPEPPKKPPKGDGKGDKPKKSRKRPGRKWPIIIPVSILLIYAVYYFASSALIPYLVEQRFPALFEKNTGLQLTVPESQFNPLDVSLLLNNVTIQTTTSGTTDSNDLLSIGTLFVDFDFISLLRGSIVSNALLLQNGSLTITRFIDKTYNISQFFQKNSREGGPNEVMDFADLPFLYSLNNISITDSEITFIDQTTEKKHRVENLRLSLPTLSNFSYDVGTYIKPRFSAVINGSPIELVGETDSRATGGEDLPTRLSCSLKSLDLPLYSTYLPVPLPFRVNTGSASGKLQISFAQEDTQGRQLTFNYQLQLEDVDLQSHDQTATLTVPLLNVEGSLDPLQSDIAIQNLLLRDPSLRISKDFSADTINSLFLADYDKEEAYTVPLERPAIRIALLIADNAKVQAEYADTRHVFNPVQISMRNYANGRAHALYENTGESSFRMSGESTDNLAVISWQGTFVDTAPVGDLEINNLGLDRVLHLIAPDDTTKGEGTLDIRGRLKVWRSDDTPLAYSLSEASVRFANISLSEDDKTWLQSSTGRASGVNMTAEDLHLGNLFLNRSEVTLDMDNMPSLLRQFNQHDETTLSGIDLQGTIDLVQNSEEARRSKLTEVHLQMNSLDIKEPRKENFALTAETEDGGIVKAKGRVALGPLKGQIETAFTNLPLKTLLAGSSSIIVGDSTMLSGAGLLDIAKGMYEGSLEISKGPITSEEQISYDFRKAGSERVRASLDFSTLNAEKINIEEPNFEFEGTQIQARESSLRSLSWEDGSITVSGLDLPSSTITTQSGFATLSDHFLSKKRTTFLFENIHIDGDMNIGNSDSRTLSLTSFELDISPLSLEYPDKKNISFNADSRDNGKITVEGNLSIFPLQSRLEVDLANISSTLLHPLSQEKKSKGSYEATLTGAFIHRYPEKQLSGTLQLDNGQLHTSDGTTLASWNHAVLENFKYSEAPQHLGIAHLKLDGPRISYTNDGSDIYTFIATTIEKHFFKENEKGSVSFSRLDIPRIDIRNGYVEYADTRLEPSWQTAFTSVTGFINNFHLTDTSDPVDYGARGSIEGSTFSINETLHPSEQVRTKELSYSLENYPLARLEAQIAPYFAVETNESRINLYYMEKEGKEPSATVEVSQIRASDPGSSLAMTLALLGQEKEKISQSIPLEENDTSTLEQILRHFQKLTIKTEVSPYLLLPSPYNELLEKSAISFSPGSSELREPEKRVLEMFSLLVEDFPRLRLDLRGVIDPSVDAKALQTQLEEQEKMRVERENKRLLQQWQERNDARQTSPQPQENAAADTIIEKDLEPFTPMSANPVRITDDLMMELGRQRLAEVYNFLLDKQTVPKENIHTTRRVSIGNDATVSGVRIDLSHINAKKE